MTVIPAGMVFLCRHAGNAVQSRDRHSRERRNALHSATWVPAFAGTMPAGNRTCLDEVTGVPGISCVRQGCRQPAVSALRAAFRFAVVVNVKLVNQDDGDDEVCAIL
ncbi:MAG: hypothetical protein ACTHL1_03530 [Burkholderiaceae bacterium]